jgi:HPt (histidine-containing phosphotransfer) domain-containing protein
MSSLDDALAAIWERSRPVVAERLAIVETAAEPGAGDETRREGVRAAHQLAGSLGTFGIHEGSDVARAIELELEGAAEPARLADLSGRLRELLAPRLA